MSARKLILVLTASAVILLTSAPVASAHGIAVFASWEGGAIKGKAYATGGGAIKAATVRITNAATGELLGETISDDKGEFSFQPALRCDHRIVVEIDAAHSAQYIVPADELPDSLPLPPEDSGREPVELPAREHAQHQYANEHPQHQGDDIRALVESAVSKHIAPLRVQLDQFEKKRRLHDIIGGVGYIFGVAGVAFYILAKRQAQGKQ